MTDNKTWDLFEFRWDSVKKVFVKKQKHLMNVSKALCYAKKRALMPVGKVNTGIVFIVVENGSYEHTNQFKPSQHQIPFTEKLQIQ